MNMRALLVVILFATGLAQGAQRTTKHFVLHIEGIDADETAQFLEAAYAEMKAFFNNEPDRKLQVRIFATKERYQAEFDDLRKDFYWNKKHRNTAGLYVRRLVTSFLWVQPDEYVTRRVLLHEVAHQFHDLLRPWRYRSSLDYCDEGLAEHLSWHNWDGTNLTIGILPQIAPVDFAARALRELDAIGGFESVVYGDADIDYSLAWGLVTFLIKKHSAKFQSWRIGINHGVDPEVAWQKQFGAITPDFVDSFEQWLKAHTQPWQIISGWWQPWGKAIEGRHGEYEPAQATLTKIPSTLTVSFDPASNVVQGVTFGFRGGRNFYLLERHPKHWEIANVIGPNAHRAKRQTFPASEGESTVTVKLGDASTFLKFDDHVADMTNVTGRVGLWVERGRGRFKCQWE